MPDISKDTLWKGRDLPPLDLPLEGFIDAVSNIDSGHGKRVGILSGVIADLAGINSFDRAQLKLAGEMHDTGKVMIPSDILYAPRALTLEEKEVIKKHPLLGIAVIQYYRQQFSQDVLDAVLMHHERWDGNGYGLGLKGEQIPLMTRVISLADTIDACHSRRKYKAPWTISCIRELLEQECGTNFDPDLARICIDNLETILGALETPATAAAPPIIVAKPGWENP